jgi:hypothetical protein
MLYNMDVFTKPEFQLRIEVKRGLFLYHTPTSLMLL